MNKTENEMPEVVRMALRCLRHTNAGIVHSLGVDSDVADALESFWRDHIAQPVTPPLAMSEELERVLEFAEETTDMQGEYAEAGWFWNPTHLNKMKKDLAAVRAQAAAPKVVKMEKVREAMALLGTLLFEYQQHMSFRKERGAIFDAALAELDAHEGGKP